MHVWKKPNTHSKWMAERSTTASYYVPIPSSANKINLSTSWSSIEKHQTAHFNEQRHIDLASSIQHLLDFVLEYTIGDLNHEKIAKRYDDKY